MTQFYQVDCELALVTRWDDLAKVYMYLSMDSTL